MMPKTLSYMQKESTVDLLKIMSPASRKNKASDDLMTELAELSLEDELLRQNLPGNLIDELVMAAVRTNYGQVPSTVHAFVGSVAVAGAEGGLWSIEGGNHLLPEKLLLLSEAVVVQSKVSHHYDLAAKKMASQLN